MKKMLAMAVAAIMSLTAMADDFYAGGSFSIWRNSTKKLTEVSILPEIGYKLNEDMSLGMTIGYEHDELGEDDDKVIVNMFDIAPYLRYNYFQFGKVALFVDGGFGIGAGSSRFHGEGSDTAVKWNIGFKPGVAFNVNEKFSVVAHFGFLGYEGVNDHAKAAGFDEGFGLKFSGNNMALGFYYNF